MVDYHYLDEEARANVADLMDGDPDMIIDLVDTLAESSPALLEELEQGVALADSRQVKESAHALKSSNAQLGASDFAALCQKMEYLSRNPDWEAANDLLDLIKQEYQKVEQALVSWKTYLLKP